MTLTMTPLLVKTSLFRVTSSLLAQKYSPQAITPPIQN